MPLSGIRVLIADDEKRLRNLLNITLSDAGAEVLLAADGGEAFRHATMSNPDCIVMDLNMPGVNGFEAIRSLRMTQPDTPILVLTGYASDATFESAREAGADDCLGKPADIAGLIETIRRLVDKRAETEN